MRNLKETLEVLQNYKKPSKLLMNKYPYYPIEEYRDRFKEACGGVEGYKAEYSALEQFQFPTGQIVYSMKCTLSILDEDGTVLMSKEGYGTHEVAVNDSGNFINLGTLGRTLMADSFKTAADEYRIFGGKSSANRGAQGGNRTSSASTNANPTTAASTSERFYFKDVPTCKKDKNGIDSYTALGYKVVGNGQCEQTPTTLLLYSNNYKNYAKQLNALLSMDPTKGVVFNCTVKPCGTQGSYVLQAMA